MKLLSITICCVWAAVNGSPYVTVPPDEDLALHVDLNTPDDYNMPEDYYNIPVDYNDNESATQPIYAEEATEEPTNLPSYLEQTAQDLVELTSFPLQTTEGSIEKRNFSIHTNTEAANEQSYSAQPTELSYDEIIIDDCKQLTNVEHNSVKIIITRSEVIHKCIPDVTRVLHSDDGSVIIIGLDAMDSLQLNEHSKLFFNKYYELPKHIQNLCSYIYNEELDVKVYVTSKVILAQLYEQIISTNYEEAINLSKYLFSYKSDASLGREVITNVVKILLENEDYAVMNYAFKLMVNDASDIVSNCFPSIFIYIFNGFSNIIHNNNKTAALRLSAEVDDNENHWLYSDCTKNEGHDMYWTFYPNLNSNLENVVFKIENDAYQMNLNLHSQMIGHYDKIREAFGQRFVNDEGMFEWQLIPTGFNENEDLLFCISHEAYESVLLPTSGLCGKKDVRGIRTRCNKEIGWNIKPI